MAGVEGWVLQHGHAAGTVTGGAVQLTAAALADVTGGVGNLPAIDKKGRVLAYTHRGAVSQSQVIGWVAVTDTCGLKEISCLCSVFLLCLFTTKTNTMTISRNDTAVTVTTEAQGGELIAVVVSLYDHHAGAVIPLQPKAGRATDQVHVAGVIDFKTIFFEAWFGVAGINIELEKKKHRKMISQTNMFSQ